ncbi:hypothetical protein ACOI1H_23920 [Loktanella sp. DJP18]|uniref:hypothetical protein n=1 Tax=Loktanella sp. DJP18 TaxID=3409788 RepID=UPI003BB5D99F
MKIRNVSMRSTAIVALLSIPFATGAAFAQETQQAPQQAQDTAQDQSSQSPGNQQTDALVATVGDAEIRGTDVMTFIGMLPPEIQSQPPQMLAPLALEQLIVRELILEQARAQNLADDPEVVALVDSSSQTATDDAMVQVWLDREMANVATDEAVQRVYDEAQAEGQENLPAIDEVRPQIEQFLLQRAMQDIQLSLRDGADIVFYDPTGKPAQPQQGQGMPSGAGTSDNQASGNDASGKASDGQSSDGEPTAGSGSESTETSGEQTQSN